MLNRVPVTTYAYTGVLASSILLAGRMPNQRLYSSSTHTSLSSTSNHSGKKSGVHIELTQIESVKDITQKPTKTQSYFKDLSVDNTTVSNLKPVTHADVLKTISLLARYGIVLKDNPVAVFIGPQSSGKSSLLEACCGHDFLPKKMGMATMKPTYVTLINSDEVKFFADGQQFKTIEEFRYDVERLNANGSITQVNLEIHDPTVCNTFLLDLPGLYYVSKGNPGSPKKIEKLTDDAVANKNNILVIAHAGPNDPATNQALQKVQDEDREDDSIGAITKVDLLKNQNTELLQSMLEGKMYPLGSGYVALSLRNSKDVAAGMSVDQKIEEEAAFFKKNPHFNPSGVIELRQRLSEIQVRKLRDRIPKLRENVKKEIEKLKNSVSFFDSLLSGGNYQLADRLGDILTNLVESSLDRAEFEERLRNEFRVFLQKYMQTCMEDIPKQSVPVFSETNMDSNGFAFSSNYRTNPSNFAINSLAELFCYGPRSPIVLDQKAIDKAVANEVQLAMISTMFRFVYDDPLGKKKNAWGRQIDRFFNGLIKDGFIVDEVGRMVQEALIAYIKTAPEGCDPISVHFVEYVVPLICKKVMQKEVKNAIESEINTKKRPNLQNNELNRHLAQIYQEHLTWNGGWSDLFKNKHQINVDVFGPEYNRAFFYTVMDSVHSTIFSQVGVNIMDKLFKGVIATTMDMLSSQRAEREKQEVKGNIDILIKADYILSHYSPE
jgi:GTPase SAR1 family protein